MKKYLLAAALPLFLLLAPACKKGNVPPLDGIWILKSEQNGMTPTIYYTDTTTKVLTFDKGHYSDNTQYTLREGVYSATKVNVKNVQLGKGPFYLLVYDNKPGNPALYASVYGNQLTISSDRSSAAVDNGVAMVFQRAGTQ